tara:strand:+ start:375 stop:515 length:141 start_codon:yes stop_codon:yes gene_type:complete
MPKVGGKHYSYTPQGYAAAERAAKRSGKKVTRKNNSKGFNGTPKPK